GGEVEGLPGLGELGGERGHVAVTAQGVEPHPGKSEARGLGVPVGGLVHVPEEAEANLFHGPPDRSSQSGSGFRRYDHSSWPRRWREMITFWISFVPSPISQSFASRKYRSTGNSRVYP